MKNEKSLPDGKKRLIILGAGNSGRKVLGAVAGDPKWQVVAFGDDDETLQDTRQNGIQIIPVDQIDNRVFPFGDMVISGIGNPVKRHDIMHRACLPHATVIHDTATIHGFVLAGSLVCANVFVSIDATVSNGVTLNIGAVVGPSATISHSVTVNQYAVIASGSFVGKLSYIGMGAKILEGRTVAPRTMVAAGAVVTKDIGEPGYVWAGVPAVCKKAWEM